MAIRAVSLAVLVLLIAETAPGAAQAPSPAAQGDFPLATDVRIGGDEKQTRFVVDLSRKVEMRAFTLANPYRVVIDLPQVSFHFPPKTGERGRGLIKAFRYGLVMPGGSRIVLDAAGPVRVEKAFVLDPSDSGSSTRRNRTGIRDPSWCSIRVMAGSTAEPAPRAGIRKNLWCSISPSRCATSWKRPANTAWS